MLVIGSRNSSNSVRLVEVARDFGTDAHLIDSASEVPRSGCKASASSASPRARAHLRTWSASWSGSSARAGSRDISEVDAVREDVRFMLPKQVRGEAVVAAAGEAS